MLSNSLKDQKVIPAEGLRFGIVRSKFYPDMTRELLLSAETYLKRAGAKTIHSFSVPGAFEIPLLLKSLAESKKFDALIALGLVIRGETPHFDYVCAEASRGIAQVSYDYSVPVGLGLLTVDNEEQAKARLNKGRDAAAAALEMVFNLKELRS